MLYNNTWNSLIKHTGLRVAVLALGTAVLAGSCGKGEEPTGGQFTKKDVEEAKNKGMKEERDKAFQTAKQNTINVLGVWQGVHNEETFLKKVNGIIESDDTLKAETSVDNNFFSKILYSDVAKKEVRGDIDLSPSSILGGFVFAEGAKNANKKWKFRTRHESADRHFLLAIKGAELIYSIVEEINKDEAYDREKVETLLTGFEDLGNKRQEFKVEENKLAKGGEIENAPTGGDAQKHIGRFTADILAFTSSVRSLLDGYESQLDAYKKSK